MRKLYYATNTRASPYLIGILFGYFLHLNRGKHFKLNRICVILGWLVGLSLIATCIFAVYGQNTLPIVEEAFYVTLTRIAWPLGLCWVVFACMQGYGGLATSFLSSPLWQPMSRLSYSAYIFHMFIEGLNGGITHTSTYFSDYQVVSSDDITSRMTVLRSLFPQMLRFWSDLGFTMLFSYLMHILIEAPFASLEVLLLPTKRASPSKPPVVETKIAEVKSKADESLVEELAEGSTTSPAFEEKSATAPDKDAV